MKPTKIPLQPSAFHDQPSNVKLQNIPQNLDPYHAHHQVQVNIFKHLQVKFKVNEIPICEGETLHTILVSSHVQEKRSVCIYLGHGFGGSSLMYFPIVKLLLEYGNVVLWEIRGMGLSKKLNNYSVPLQQAETFYVKPIDVMLRFYQNYNQIFFVSHSFGGYLTLLYIIKQKLFANNIQEVILLSPAGITPKQEDYKSKMKGFSDCLHVLGNQISWRFHITYKSPFRCICACFKHRVLGDAVKNCGFTPDEQILMRDLLITMVELGDGSQGVFFNYFQPRVIPKFPIKPIFTQEPQFPITIFYGGQEDWVDKTGAEYLVKKFPSKISIKIVKECGHNFPFAPELLKQSLQEVFVKYKTKEDSLRKSTQEQQNSLKADSSDQSLNKLTQIMDNN